MIKGPQEKIISLDRDRLLIALSHKRISVYSSAICISKQKYEEMSKKYKLFQRKNQHKLIIEHKIFINKLSFGSTKRKKKL